MRVCVSHILKISKCLCLTILYLVVDRFELNVCINSYLIVIFNIITMYVSNIDRRNTKLNVAKIRVWTVRQT